MPRQLALLLCTGFVLYLLRLERRQSEGVSSALWIPTLWVLAIASKPLGIWFGTVGDAESGSTLDRWLLTSLAVAAMVVVAHRGFDWPGALRRHGWLLALLAYMLVSTLWSDITGIAVRRWVRAAIVIVMGLAIASEANPRQALESVLRRSAYILVPFSLMLIKYYPGLGVEYARWSGLQMWVGVTVHKNTLGRLCLLSAFFMFWVLYRRWKSGPSAGSRVQVWGDVSVLLIALFLLRGAEGAYSATSLGTFAIGTALLLGLYRLSKSTLPLPRTALLALVVFLMAFGAAAPFLGGSNLAGFSSAFGRTETLTGRTETWAELTPLVERQPWVGHGFASFWTTDRREFYRMSHGHNGYLDVLLELGVVGFGLFGAWLASCARAFHASLSEDYDWGSLALCLLFMAVVYNYTESALNSPTEQMTAVVILTSMVVSHGAIRASARSHLRMRVHVPPERDAGTAPAKPGLPENRGIVRLLGRDRGQRRGGARTGYRHPGSDRVGD